MAFHFVLFRHQASGPTNDSSPQTDVIFMLSSFEIVWASSLFFTDPGLPTTFQLPHYVLFPAITRS